MHDCTMIAWLHRFASILFEAYGVGDEDDSHSHSQTRCLSQTCKAQVCGQSMPDLTQDSPEGNPPMDPVDAEIHSLPLERRHSTMNIVFDNAETEICGCDCYNFCQNPQPLAAWDGEKLLQQRMRMSVHSRAVAPGSSWIRLTPTSTKTISGISPASTLSPLRGSSIYSQTKLSSTAGIFQSKLEAIEEDGNDDYGTNLVYRMLDLDPEMRMSFEI